MALNADLSTIPPQADVNLFLARFGLAGDRATSENSVKRKSNVAESTFHVLG